MLKIYVKDWKQMYLLVYSLYEHTGGRPSYWKQGVKLLSSPVQVDIVGGICVTNLVKVAGSFDASSGEVSIIVSFPGAP